MSQSYHKLLTLSISTTLPLIRKMFNTPTKNKQSNMGGSSGSPEFPTQLSQFMANHAKDEADPMTMGCSNLMEMDSNIDRSPATKPLSIKTTATSVSDESTENNGFVIIDHAEVSDMQNYPKTSPSRKVKDALDQVKLAVWVLAWNGMKLMY